MIFTMILVLIYINTWFDTSCYSNKPIKNGVNKKVLGMFKDETGDN